MEAYISEFLWWIAECNQGATTLAKRVPLIVEGGTAVGYLEPQLAVELANLSSAFSLQSTLQQLGGAQQQQQQQPQQPQQQQQQQQQEALEQQTRYPAFGGNLRHCEPAAARQALVINPALATPQQRTDAVGKVLECLRDQGKMGSWMGELYPVALTFQKPLLLLERAAATLFAIKAYGVHVIGFVTLPNGTQEMWLARRSRDRPTWPGKLDQMVAGGQPHGMSCLSNVVKECEEEASIRAELAQQARAVGAVNYTSRKLGGIGRDVMFVYDLELPLDFIPRPQDGEVEEFFRLPGTEVAALLVAKPPHEAFKTNCNLVVIDFLVRHGYLTADMPGAKEYEGRASLASPAVKLLRPGDVRGLERLLRQDFERNQYFVSGVLTDAIYDEQCEFVDPTVRFKGRDLWKRNLSLLTPFLIEPQIQLKSLQRLPPLGTRQGRQQQQQQQEGPDRQQQQQQQQQRWLKQLTSLLPSSWLAWAAGGATATRTEPVQLYAEWLLTCYVALPWRPYVSVNGSITCTLNGAANQIVRHVEAWDISGTEALLLLLRPSERAVWKRRRAE
ncbi:hypothetical protein N2152v2_001659 [Parachlorella kessleri]